jgi:hypothetical protein
LDQDVLSREEAAELALWWQQAFEALDHQEG